jgi:hypothetical protein
MGGLGGMTRRGFLRVEFGAMPERQWQGGWVGGGGGLGGEGQGYLRDSQALSGFLSTLRRSQSEGIGAMAGPPGGGGLLHRGPR